MDTGTGTLVCESCHGACHSQPLVQTRAQADPSGVLEPQDPLQGCSFLPPGNLLPFKFLYTKAFSFSGRGWVRDRCEDTGR